MSLYDNCQSQYRGFGGVLKLIILGKLSPRKVQIYYAYKR